MYHRKLTPRDTLVFGEHDWGDSVAVLAKKHGVSRQRIYQILARIAAYKAQQASGAVKPKRADAGKPRKQP